MVKLDSKNEKYCGAEAYLHLSRIWFKKEDLKNARQFFIRAVKLDPILIMMDEVWQFAKDGFFPALEYLYKSAKKNKNKKMFKVQRKLGFSLSEQKEASKDDKY